jgi:nicotinate-nucleotide pyrophosphorylase (carboxylating)
LGLAPYSSTPMPPLVPVPDNLAEQVAAALAEDIGSGDLTAGLIPTDRTGRASVITREAAVVCGIPYVNATFARLDSAVTLDWRVAEGDVVIPDQLLFTLDGPARALLTGERTALNFLQFLSATATAAHEFAALLAGTACRVLDTRKTIPGLRAAQKYAVRVGGGQNHRIGLFDGVLIKENHIMAAGSIGQAVTSAKATGTGAMIEVEVENLAELAQALAAGPDIVMLDEFSLPDMREAVALNRAAPRPVKLEASGSVTRESIREIALTGVDYISVGSITKHVRAVDLSMRFDWR